MSTPIDPNRLSTLIHPLATAHGWRLVVLFGSVAREGRGRDLDLAVLPEHPPSLLEQGRWWAELDACLPHQRIDLLVLGPHTSPLTLFEVLREGRCLFEDQAGRFEGERDRAFFLYADSQWIRDHAKELKP